MKHQNHMVLIDGPNGSGKGYLISKLTEEIYRRYNQEYPSCLVKLLNVKSILKDKVKQKVEARQTYNFDNDMFVHLVEKHLEFFECLEKELQEDYATSFDNRVVLADRYIPSFYVYQMCMNDNPPPIEFWYHYNSQYENLLKRLTENNTIIQIFLLPKEETIVERLTADNRPIDRELIKGQLKYYRDYIDRQMNLNLKHIHVFGDEFDLDTILKSFNMEKPA